MAPAVWLARLLEAMALGVEEPSVIATADPARLHLAVVERGAAVRTARVDEPGPPRAVAEEDEVLAQYAHGARRVAGVGGEPDGMPVAPHQLAHGCAGADLGQLAQVGGPRPSVARAGVCHRGG